MQGHPPRMSYAQVAQHHKDNQSKAAKQSSTTPQGDKSVVELGGINSAAQTAQKGGPLSGASQTGRSQQTQQVERDSSVRDNRGKTY